MTATTTAGDPVRSSVPAAGATSRTLTQLEEAERRRDVGQADQVADQTPGQQQSSDTAWRDFLTELDWWIAQHGNAAVTQKATSQGRPGRDYPLGIRVRDARVAHRAGNLPPTRVADLEQRNGWIWNGVAHYRETSWDAIASRLETHLAGGGTLSTLDSATYQWMRLQRQADLTDERRKRLGKLPGVLTLGKIDQFLTAAARWLAAAPAGATMAELRNRDTITLDDGSTYPLGVRATYLRTRHAGPKPLHHADADRIAALPGWTWGAPRVRTCEPADAHPQTS